MGEATMWWILSGLLVAAELASGTFYLLMLASGTTAAALAAWAGAALAEQMVTAALVGGLAVVLGRSYRKRRPPPDQDQHLDIGEVVDVQSWDGQGTTQVKHRGALWTGVCASGQTPQAGRHRIQALEGNRLVLQKI
jgi:membrane protein implicated in regulation of membrane protease activity